MWDQLLDSLPLGKARRDLVVSGIPVFLSTTEDRALHQVDQVVVSAEKRGRLFPINLRFAGGHILHDLKESEPVFTELASEWINWQDVIDMNGGTEITDEDLKSLSDSSLARHVFLTNETHPFIRAVISKQKP
jgi:hypothetical protein